MANKTGAQKVTVLDPSYILDQYEALRREAIEAESARTIGHGLAVFLYRGMSAWISALKALGKPPMAVSAQNKETLPQVDLPPAVRCDLTTVLANMVMTCYRQEIPR